MNEKIKFYEYGKNKFEKAAEEWVRKIKKKT